jgi:hypothetical protein
MLPVGGEAAPGVGGTAVGDGDGGAVVGVKFCTTKAIAFGIQTPVTPAQVEDAPAACRSLKAAE